MERNCEQGNCMRSCKHACVRDIMKREEIKDSNGNVFAIMNTHVGYEHYCDIDSPNYKAWHERNKDNTYEVYKNDLLDCYEPTEDQRQLGKMLDLCNEILEKK